LDSKCHTLIFAARSDKTGSSLKKCENKCEANVNKTEPKSLLVIYNILPLPSASKKMRLVLHKTSWFSRQKILIFLKN